MQFFALLDNSRRANKLGHGGCLSYVDTNKTSANRLKRQRAPCNILIVQPLPW
jgi:hypothetical protein